MPSMSGKCIMRTRTGSKVLCVIFNGLHAIDSPCVKPSHNSSDVPLRCQVLRCTVANCCVRCGRIDHPSKTKHRNGWSCFDVAKE